MNFIVGFDFDHTRFLDRSLGPLNHIHIWHDNSGADGSASWFLKSIVVRDLQTKEISYFICQRWLAVDEDDGKVTRCCSLIESTLTCLMIRLNEQSLCRAIARENNSNIF